jgi:hypothetical protein
MASPVRGSNIGPLINWIWLVTADGESLGELGKDLEQRWRDPQEQARLLRRAAFLRTSGTDVLTLADPDDAVVRPDEALLPAPGQSLEELLVQSRVHRAGSHGHGAILEDSQTWQRILDVIGPQEPLTAAKRSQRNTRDPIDQELQALKARLKAQGRIRK